MADHSSAPSTVGAQAECVDGSSPVTAVFGLIILLGFLLTSSQALVHLHATSVVGATAFDAARAAAADGAGCADATSMVGRRLGAVDGIEIDCRDDGHETLVVVRVTSPARALGGPLRIWSIERAALVRTERLR